MFKDEEQVEEDKKNIGKIQTPADKISWKRKREKLEELVSEVQRGEDEILEIRSRNAPKIKKIEKYRETMVYECIHPYEYLVHKGQYIECKFCNKKLRIVDKP